MLKLKLNVTRFVIVLLASQLKRIWRFDASLLFYKNTLLLCWKHHSQAGHRRGRGSKIRREAAVKNEKVNKATQIKGRGFWVLWRKRRLPVLRWVNVNCQIKKYIYFFVICIILWYLDIFLLCIHTSSGHFLFDMVFDL